MSRFQGLLSRNFADRTVRTALRLLLSMAIMCAATMPVKSQQFASDSTRAAQTERPHEEIDLEIDALLVDQTQSKLGRDFYELFFAAWSGPSGAKNYTITITEKPLARNGTQISMRVNDADVFEQFLLPRYDAIEDAVASAIGAAAEYLINYELIQKDLQGDDMQGSGIF